MMISEQDITAEVYHESKGIHYVKVIMLGLYISGITVRPSPKFPEKGLWVQMPSYKLGAIWKRYIEFDNESSLKDIMESKCREAVENYESNAIDINGIPDPPTDEELDDPGKILDQTLKDSPP